MSKRSHDSPLPSTPSQEDSCAAARAALLLMAAADAGCSSTKWTDRVILGSGMPADLARAARELATVPKPLQCRAKCGPEGLTIAYSPITDARHVQAHTTQVEMLERGEGVIGSLLSEFAHEPLNVTLSGAGQLFDISKKALEMLERDYLITMPLALSRAKAEGEGPGGIKWSVLAGYARPVSEGEVEEWINLEEGNR